LICAKFGKDLFNISKVIGRKKSGPVFLTHSVVYSKLTNAAHDNAKCNGHKLTIQFSADTYIYSSVRYGGLVRRTVCSSSVFTITYF